MEDHILPGERVERADNGGKVLDISPVISSEAQK